MNLFGGDPGPRRIIREGVYRVDGERTFGGLSKALRYIFTLDTGGCGVRGLRIRGADTLHGFPLIGGITRETADTGVLVPLPELGTGEPAVRTVSVEFIQNDGWKAGRHRLRIEHGPRRAFALHHRHGGVAERNSTV